mgnify:CR=1 FL=1
MKKTYHSRQLEGILCVDKPQDWTSFDVVAKMRGIADCHKIGHGGTLDPMATGVLPLFFGRSAKAMELMPVQDKRYTASIRFGVTTDTQDCTGNILSTSEKPVTREALEAALVPLRGTIDQLPPMYSAVWVDGQRLYKLARAGKEVERPTRQVTIHRLDLLEFDPENRTCVIDVACSKGTYIRTLCHDIGEALGCGGMLTALRRTETLGFTTADCHTLEELKQASEEGRFEELLMPVDGGMVTYPTLEQKKAIIENTVGALRAMGYDCPKVGVLACVEKLNPKMPETVEGDALKQMNQRGELTGCVVEGPISYDCAVSREIAAFKGFESPCAGDCDVLVAPNIHAGNIMGKMLTVTCKAKMAGFIVGARCPIVMTSRGSSAEEKYLSIVISAAAARNP